MPIFNDAKYELPSASALIGAAWPKNVTINGRAVLAITSKLGAFDFATEERVSVANIVERHYHHIFPHSLLSEAELENSFIAMNCALIKDKTNLNIGRKEPLQYLKDRYKWADYNTVRHRLSSHLIPVEELANGGYENLSDQARISKIVRDYNAFIEKRARLFEIAARKLCNGGPLNARDIFQEVND